MMCHKFFEASSGLMVRAQVTAGVRSVQTSEICLYLYLLHQCNNMVKLDSPICCIDFLFLTKKNLFSLTH